MAVPGKKAPENISLTLTQGGAEDFDIFCKPCDQDDIRLPAFGYCIDCEKHLCQNCFNNHRKPKPLRHHQLLDTDHMQKIQKARKSTTSSPGDHTNDLTQPCTKHTKEVIKFYCQDHKALICSVCVTLEHSPSSCHVDYIPNISEQTLDSNEFKQTLIDITKLSDKCCLIQKVLTKRVATSTTSLKHALEELENFRKEINQKLDELEKEIKSIASTIQHDNNKMLKTTEAMCHDINKLLKESADSLKHLNINKKADRLFTEMKKTQKLMLEKEEEISQLPTTYVIDDYIFKPNQAMVKTLQDEKSLGTLDSKKLKQVAQVKNQAVEVMKMSTVRYLNIKSSKDINNCWITGIAFAHQNLLFVADYKNSSIKKIEIEKGVVVEKLHLESRPWDLTIINQDTLAVMLPRSKIIQFISFSTGSLTLTVQLKVNGECHGISHQEGKLAITLELPPQLQIIDIGTGLTETTVGKDSNSEDFLTNPWYVTTNCHSVYVSDGNKHAVLWLNWQGEILGRFEALGCPRGVTLLDDGSFLLTDISKNCICRISGDCTDRKTILAEVSSPSAITWSDESSTICVSTNMHDNSQKNNYIKLYKKLQKQRDNE